MSTNEINGRFKDAPFYEKSRDFPILVGGSGGIGSYVVYNLLKSTLAKIYLVEYDTVNTHNIGTQFFRTKDINEFKGKAIADIMGDFDYSYFERLHHINKQLEKEVLPISISCFDNMEARKQLFNSWKNSSSKSLFVDGRLRANLYEVYIVTEGREDAYEKTLFDDSEVDDGPCTFKQTAYFASLIGARITHAVVNYLTNLSSEEDVCNLPFKITEIGEPFLIKTEYHDSSKT